MVNILVVGTTKKKKGKGGGEQTILPNRDSPILRLRRTRFNYKLAGMPVSVEGETCVPERHFFFLLLLLPCCLYVSAAVVNIPSIGSHSHNIVPRTNFLTCGGAE